MVKLSNVAEFIRDNARQKMNFVSDVDGVHTTRKGGVSIGGPPPEEFDALTVMRNGVKYIDLIPKDPFLQQKIEVIIARFEDRNVWEFYQFHTPDGQAVQNLLKKRVRTIITSGREAAPVHERFGSTLVAEIDGDIIRPEVYLGVKDKLTYFRDEVNLDLGNTIFITDGHQDAPVLQAVQDAGGIAVATADAESAVMDAAQCITREIGGEGAFAEVAQAYLNFLEEL